MYKLVKIKMIKGSIIDVVRVWDNLTYEQVCDIVNDHIKQVKPQWWIEKFPFYLLDAKAPKQTHEIVVEKNYDYLYRIEKI